MRKLKNLAEIRIKKYLFAYIVETVSSRGFYLKDYIEQRAIEIANYIITTNATVRQTAKKFGISKSTVHMEVTKRNGLFGR